MALLVLGRRSVDLSTGHLAGTDRALRPKEVEVLRYLASHAGRPVSVEELLVEVWGYSARVKSRTAYATLHRLRDALGHPPELTVVVGKGYQLDLGPGHAPGGRIPSDPDPFFGRGVELDALDAARAPLVTLLGPGGVGKSRLAREWARRVADRFPGGAWFVALEGCTTVVEVSRAVCVALGKEVGRNARSAAERALGELTPALLVLDAAEGAVASLGHVTASRHRLLATSQVPLRVRGEHRIPLGGLASSDLPSPAVALFLARAEAAGCDLPLDRARVLELVRRIDGHPLAIEIAAAHAALLPLDSLHRALDEGQLRLVEQGRPERHHGLDGAVAWAVSRLEPAQRAALARSCLFVEGMDLETATLLLADLGPAEALLAALVERGFVRVRVQEGVPRYQVWPVVRMSVRLAGGELLDARRRRIDMYRALSSRISVGPSGERLPARFGLSDARSAFDGAWAEGDLDAMLTIAPVICWLCAEVGPHEVIRTIEPRITPLLELAPLPQAVSIAVQIARAYVRFGAELDRPRALFQALLGRDPPEPLRAIVLAEDAALCGFQSPADAVGPAERALALAEGCGDAAALHHARCARVAIANELADAPTARALLHQLREDNRSRPSTYVPLTLNLAVVESNDLQPERAAALLDGLFESHPAAPELSRVSVLQLRASVALLREEPERAIALAAEAEQRFRAEGSPRASSARETRVRAAFDLGAWDEGAALLRDLEGQALGTVARARLEVHTRGERIWPELAAGLAAQPSLRALHVQLRLAVACAASTGALEEALRLLDLPLPAAAPSWRRGLLRLDRAEIEVALGQFDAADRTLGALTADELRPTFSARAEAASAAVGVWFGRGACALPRATRPTERAWVELFDGRIRALRGEQVRGPTMSTTRDTDRLLIALGWRMLPGWRR